MKTSEILDKAADVIERNGWARGDWYETDEYDEKPPEECKVCAGAAINIVLDFPPDFEHDDDDFDERAAGAFAALARRVDEAVRADLDDEFPLFAENVIEAVTSWNDASRRTAEEVVRELRAAAASEREAGR